MPNCMVLTINRAEEEGETEVDRRAGEVVTDTSLRVDSSQGEGGDPGWREKTSRGGEGAWER